MARIDSPLSFTGIISESIHVGLFGWLERDVLARLVEILFLVITRDQELLAPLTNMVKMSPAPTTCYSAQMRLSMIGLAQS